MTFRDWTDPRDGRHWTVWIELSGPKPIILAFASGDDHLHTVRVDFTDGLEHRSDADLQRLLDEGRGEGGAYA